MTKKLIEPTKGEWYVDRGVWIKSKDPAIEPSSWDIAETIGGFSDRNETKANAKLMAAAPKMLEALREVRKTFHMPKDREEEEFQTIIDAAIEAAELWVEE